MGSPSGLSRDSIGVIIVFKASEIVQAIIYGGSSANVIYVEKEDGGGVGLAVYYFCWGAILGIRIT